MDGFIYIRNAEDDAYVNHGRNFKGMEQAASAAVILYFESPISSAVGPSAYDKITLAVTANKEKEAMIAINGALAGGKSGGTTVIADDHVSVYCDQDVTGVTTISKATAATLRKIESITPSGDGTGGAADANTRILTAADSGTTFLCNIATNTAALRLPAPVAGLNFKFILDVASDAEATKDLIVSTADNAVNIMGVALDAGGVHDVVPTTSVLSLDTSDGAAGAGDRFGVVCDGTNYYVEDATALTTGDFNVADNAV